MAVPGANFAGKRVDSKGLNLEEFFKQFICINIAKSYQQLWGGKRRLKVYAHNDQHREHNSPMAPGVNILMKAVTSSLDTFPYKIQETLFYVDMHTETLGIIQLPCSFT